MTSEKSVPGTSIFPPPLEITFVTVTGAGRGFWRSNPCATNELGSVNDACIAAASAGLNRCALDDPLAVGALLSEHDAVIPASATAEHAVHRRATLWVRRRGIIRTSL